MLELDPGLGGAALAGANPLATLALAAQLKDELIGVAGQRPRPGGIGAAGLTREDAEAATAKDRELVGPGVSREGTGRLVI